MKNRIGGTTLAKALRGWGLGDSIVVAIVEK
jgi:hypothetical protein